MLCMDLSVLTFIYYSRLPSIAGSTPDSRETNTPFPTFIETTDPAQFTISLLFMDRPLPSQHGVCSFLAVEAESVSESLILRARRPGSGSAFSSLPLSCSLYQTLKSSQSDSLCRLSQAEHLTDSGVERRAILVESLSQSLCSQECCSRVWHFNFNCSYTLEPQEKL